MTEQPHTKKQGEERPPVIAVMGHVDHGKSKLLDYIRQTNIVDKEAGGITQHTSAYEVTHNHKKITFLDTPGHSAFTSMRERGAEIADIAILVVSAEEGVKAQTEEALASIQKSGTPFVVAINKIDKPNANPERAKQELAEKGVFVEGYGGSIPFALISALTGQGVTELLDLLLLVAELEELTGNPELPAQGFVLESHLDPKSGVTSTFIIKDGTLRVGDFVVVGSEITKIKRLNDFLGQQAKELSFSAPAEITGFSGIPQVGAPFSAQRDKKLAEQKALSHQKEDCQKVTDCLDKSDALIVPLIIKADVAGTLEALEKELNKIQVDKTFVQIIGRGVGAITENDVKLVQAFPEGKIIGFRVKTERGAQAEAEKNSVLIQTSDIIYKLSEWLEEELKRIVPKQTSEEVLGRAKILKHFGQTKDRQIIGGTVVSGKLSLGREVKIIRRDNELGRGKILSLQLQKIKVDEVTEANQFGAEIESRVEIAGGDYIEAFELVIK